MKALGSGRNESQRVHEFLVNIPDSKRVSLYEHYYARRSFEKLESGREVEKNLPPP